VPDEQSSGVCEKRERKEKHFQKMVRKVCISIRRRKREIAIKTSIHTHISADIKLIFAIK
jgi:hypothetical protein